MRIGWILMPTDPWPETVRRAQRLESLGYDHVWVYDHLSWQRYRDRPWHATYPWLAALAASTTTIRLGTMVANPNIRHPLLLAKDAMTIDTISEGRLTIGLGAGGTGFDVSVLGQPPLTLAQRHDRFEEYVPLLDGLLRGTITDHAGAWYTVDGARLLPGCVQQPRLPLAIAATGPRGIALAARFCDAWISNGDPTRPGLDEASAQTAIATQVALFERGCEAAQRDPATLDRIFNFGLSDARPLSSVEAFNDFAGRYGELGFTDIVLHHPRSDDPVWNEPDAIVDQIADART